jgi:hypothetical protein
VLGRHGPAGLPCGRLIGSIIATAAAGILRIQKENAMTDLSRFDLEILPSLPLIQHGRGAQRLSVDFSIHSRDEREWTLRRIDLSVYGRDDQLLLRRRLDEQAASPSIATLPERVLPPRGSLYLFNPFVSFEQEAVLERLHYTFHLTSPSDETVRLSADVFPKAYQQQTSLSLPLKGRIWVDDGNDFYSHHRRLLLNHPLLRDLGMQTNMQRYAWDLMLVDEKGNPYHPDDTDLNHFPTFGASIYAPAAGVIVAARNELRDNEPWAPGFTMEEIADDPTLMMGNYLLIDHGSGEFSTLGHCRQGSLLVNGGQHVREGQLIGQVGNSGWSAYPHLHYQLTDGPEFLTSEGLPAHFASFQLMLGGRLRQMVDSYPDTGEFIFA